MASFVTTRRMDPALARRIEASIHGRSARGGASGSIVLRRVVSWARVAAVVLLVVAAASFIRMRQWNRDLLAGSRAELLAKVHARVSGVPVDDRNNVARVQPWLVRGSGIYEGDLVAAELAGPGALASALARPLVYVRGPLSEFVGPVAIATAAATSFKDTLLLCLLEPPKERTESALMGKVHAAYGGGARLESRTSGVRRLYDAEAGLRFLKPSFETEIRAAKDLVELSRLDHAFTAAPLDNAIKAGAARLLLFALDEEGDPRVPAELDGERPHDVRIGLVDLAQQRPLLRLRKRVDPSWISVQKRIEYASGLDGCALALDVIASASGK